MDVKIVSSKNYVVYTDRILFESDDLGAATTYADHCPKACGVFNVDKGQFVYYNKKAKEVTNGEF